MDPPSRPPSTTPRITGPTSEASETVHEITTPSSSATTGERLGLEAFAIEMALESLLRDPTIDRIQITRPLNGNPTITYCRTAELLDRIDVSFSLDLGDEKISA
jgi:hypothetical protein